MELLHSTRTLVARCWGDRFIKGTVLLLVLTKILPCVCPMLLGRFQTLRDRYRDRYTISNKKTSGWFHRWNQRTSVYTMVTFDFFLLGVTRAVGPWTAVVLACLAMLNGCVGLIVSFKMASDVMSAGPNDRLGRMSCSKADTTFQQLVQALDAQLECEVLNRYQDLLTPPELLLVIFAAQTMLLVLLLQSIGKPLVEEGEVMTTRMYTYWALGVLIQLTADSQLGAEWGGSEGPYWYLLLTRSRRRTHAVKVETCVPGLLADMEWLCFPEIVLRCLCSLLVNQVFRNILRMIIPLVLVRTRDDMSFVKDAVAVLFIVLLDDLPVAKKMQFVPSDDVESGSQTADDEKSMASSSE